jgi:hypothetical protein
MPCLCVQELEPLDFVLRGQLNGVNYGLELIPGYHLRQVVVKGCQFGSPQVRSRVCPAGPTRRMCSTAALQKQHAGHGVAAALLLHTAHNPRGRTRYFIMVRADVGTSDDADAIARGSDFHIICLSLSLKAASDTNRQTTAAS